jgi:hypothetical protein
VLDGSVRRSDDLLRFTAQLIDATSSVQIWADRFDGEIKDVFTLQDRITESVIAAIEPNIQLAEIERLRKKAYERFQRLRSAIASATVKI